MSTFSIEKLHQERPFDATFKKSCCGSCQAFKMGGCGSNSQYRKFHDRLGYCAWTLIKNKMMTVYENNVPCGKFCSRKGVMVAIGK